MTGIQQLDSVFDGLLRTREILSDGSRWLKGTLVVNSRVCLNGAAKLATSCHMDEWTEPAQDVVEQLGLELWLSPWRERGKFHGRVNVPDFNDHDDTTHADVLALIDAAMEKRVAMLACAC